MIQYFADWCIYSLLRFDPASKIGGSLNFFVYDTVKIYLLVLVIIGCIAFIRTFLSPHKLREIFSRQRFGIGNISASTLGALTPFCSCSSIPIFI